jgi:hypothetical protein
MFKHGSMIAKSDEFQAQFPESSLGRGSDRRCSILVHSPDRDDFVFIAVSINIYLLVRYPEERLVRVILVRFSHRLLSVWAFHVQ